MRKYIAVAKILFKAQIIYRFDVIMTAVGTVWRVLFARILWGAVFAGRDTVGGFDYQAMLSYYVVCSFLASIEMSSGVSGEVSSRIRGGTFSKFMVIPTNPRLHMLSQNFGAAGYYALFSAAAAAFCAFAFNVRVSLAPDISAIIIAVLIIPAGLAFMTGYHFIVGILAFKFQDVNFFLHVQGSVIAFFTGAVIPLTLLPDSVQSVIKYLPFTYVTYMPAMLLTGRAGAGEGFFGLAVITAWCAAIMITGELLYERLRIKYDGVGI